MSRDWKQFAIFYAFAFVLLALVPLLSALFGTSMNFGQLAEHASAATGIEWTSNLWNVVRLSFAEPGLWLLILGSSVPTLAALATLTLFAGRAEWRAFLIRFNPFGSVMNRPLSSLLFYVLLIVGSVACLFAAGILRETLSPGSYAKAMFPSMEGFGIAILLAAFLDQGAVLEEGGWRGFATPLLQDRVLSPLAAAFVIGIAWALWHLPRDIVVDLPGRLGVVTYLTQYLPSFALGTVAVSVVAAYFMNRIGGSVIPAIVAHGLSNDSMHISGIADVTQALTPYHQVTKAAPFAVFAVILIAIGGRELGRRR